MIKKLIIKYIGALIMIVVLFAPLFNFSKKVEAAGPLGFGGLVNFMIPCTCSGGMYIWFTPLFIGPLQTTGSLIYTPATLLFQNYMPGVPGTWELGTFLPAGQSCLIYVGTACVPLVGGGTMIMVGTSRP